MRFDDLFLALSPLAPSIICAATITDSSMLLLLAKSVTVGIVGFLLCNSLIPVVAGYTLKKGLSGKDLGKKGTSDENKDIPEALGLVTGTSYLVCAIISQLLFAKTFQQQMVYNSALFSVCFMIFLGFTDDTLDLKWRYKLILPTIASMPLLSAYSGSTSIYIPERLQSLFMVGRDLTAVGNFVNLFAIVDTKAHGAIIELGYLFKVFMGLLAVFCTNSINIYAGINGLECGQAYVIGATILFFKLYEISRGEIGENQIFAVVMIIPFVTASLALLRNNWFPATVFVGDTFCYFAGMAFAVIGIHGHFSKTLLLLFVPQIFNFLYSVPQLFKFVPCPRHRLPRVNLTTGLLYYSAFPCESHQYKLLKVSPDSTECPNMTLICAVLRICGPMKERSLCLALLMIQVIASVGAFSVRYFFLENVK